MLWLHYVAYAAGAIVLAGIVLKLAFPYVMLVRAAKDQGLWVPKDMLALGYALLGPGTLSDVIFNTFRGSLEFRELPRWGRKEVMFSNRVQRWVNAGPALGGWRYDKAIKWGKLLNFAARGTHIKLPSGV